MKQKIFHCIILLFLVFERFAVQAQKTAVCFLTRQSAMQTIDFAQTLIRDANEDDLDVFIAVDDNSFKTISLNISTSLRFIQIPNEQCNRAGFRETMSMVIGAPPNAWDKALFHFILLSRSYAFVWLIEEDVFIPSTRAFLTLHRLYSKNTDLVITSNRLNQLGDPVHWHWWHAPGKFLPPWSASMANVAGLSRRMLHGIHEYVRWRGFVPYHEYCFNTLALHLNLTIVTPTELSTLVHRTNYSFDAIKRQPNNLFHPVKDLRLQNTWRERSVLHHQSNAAKGLICY